MTLLTVSMPMGAVSDRIGRKPPMVGGLLALAAASMLFAFAESLPWLFAARLVQGAADAVTWVVGFALIADLYGQEERGRVMGLVMSGTNFAFMFGPTLGGWLYEAGGIRLPFLFVAALAARRRGRVPLVRPAGDARGARDRPGRDGAARRPPSPRAPRRSSPRRRPSRCSSRCCRST